MADTKISQMTAASTLTGAEVVPVLQGGANRRTTAQDIADLATSGATDLAYTASPTGGTVTSSTGTDAALTLADGTNAGLMAPAQHTKLSGIASAATANSTDAQLRDRSTHTGTQAISTVTGLQTALDGKESSGAAAAAVAAHEAAADPHPGYRLESDTTDAITEGSTNLWHTAARVRAVVLTGLSTATSAIIDATDTVLGALGKLQAQITANLATLTGHTSNTSNPHSTTAAQVGAAASGAVTGSGLTMATARILGRSTASTGAVEEISVGSGLSLSGGTLSSTASGGSPGGSGTELQYRNGTSFAAVSGSSVSGSNVTFGGTLTGTDVIAGASSMHTFVGRTDQGLASLASYLVGIKVNGSTFFSSSLNNGSNAWCRGLHFGPEYYSGDSFAIMRDGTSGVMQISSGNLDTLRNIRAGTVAIGISAKTASYTVTVYDGALTADCTSGAVTFTLPALSGTTPGELHIFKKIDSSGNALNVDANGSETIDGSTSAQATSTQWGTIRVMVNADKSGWLTF